MSEEQVSGASASPTGAFVPNGIEPASGLDQRLQSPSEVTIAICGNARACKHDFQGWREFEDGGGGETVCTKCGIGAMAWTLSLDI